MPKTLAQIQTMTTNKYDQREIINELLDFLETFSPSPGGDGAQSYIALINQVGSNNVDVVELVNTLGTNTWSSSTGFYYTTFDDIVFDSTKIYMGGVRCQIDGTKYTSIPINSGDQGAILGYLNLYFGDNGSGKLYVEVDAVDASLTACDLSALLGNGSVFCLPEIRVYP